jgi:hypothetical protein
MTAGSEVDGAVRGTGAGARAVATRQPPRPAYRTPRPWMSGLSGAALVVAIAASTGCMGSGKKPAGGGTSQAAGGAAGIKVQGTHVFGSAEQPEEVTALCLVDSALFVGTKKRLHVVTYSPAPGAGVGGSFAPHPEISIDAKAPFEVASIRADGKQVLVATSDGYMSFDGRSWSSEGLGPINDALPYAKGLWVARNRGLDHKEPGSEWKEQKIPYVQLNPTLTSRVKALARTPDGRLWIGSEFGIYSYSAADKKWGPQLYGNYQNIMHDMITNEKGNSDLCGNQVNRLDVDAESGKLLVCTNTGLSVYDGKDGFKTYQGDYEILSSEGGKKQRVKQKGTVALPAPNVTCALSVGSVLWVGTAEGLARLDGEALQLFDTEQGLPSSAVSSLAFDEARKVLFVGTDKGLVALGPVAASR